MNKYIVDTNIWLDYPQVIEEENYELYSLTSVLKELDGLKKSLNPETSFNARRAAVYISRNIDKVKWISTEEKKIPVDDQLLEVCSNKNITLLTNDIYLKVRATIENIPVSGYSHKDDYDGVYYWYLKNNEYEEVFSNIYETGELPKNLEFLNENQYVIVKNLDFPYINKQGEKDYEYIGAFVFREGKLKGIKNNLIKNKYINCIAPKNEEQSCLFDALGNREITIVYAGGKFGTGKSFILNNFALQELERESISKIVYIPNNSYTENAMEIGYLPGSQIEKVEGQIGPLIDLIGIDRVHEMLGNEELEVVPMNSIRGRSFQNSIILVNEAQNLTEDHIKLLIGRCGENTRIFFDGDIKQADSQLFRNKNGLKLLLSLRKSKRYSKLFSTVKLLSTERSETAQCADYLDNLSGTI